MATPETTHPIGLVAALSQEYAIAEKVLSSTQSGFICVQSGMGRAAGFLAAEKLGRDNRELAGLVSIGFCGALKTGLPTGTIILPDEIITQEGETFTSDKDWVSHIASLLKTDKVVSGQKLYCAADVVETSDQKANLHHSSKAWAVDMESAGIAHAAMRFEVPFVAIRVVLDEITDTLPQATRNAVTEQGDLNIKGLLSGLLQHPRDILILMRLGRKTSIAQKQLQKACEALLAASSPQ